jgi:GTP pyrophosphokinase
VLRQLLAWEREMSAPLPSQGLLEDRIYVLTPEAAVVELARGATPVDFAYSLHTTLGHRCRGARIDGAMAPLSTALRNGQTVEIIAAKEGGPSRDWLNPELGFLASPRARAKVRAWFNALALQETVSRGREAVERLLQREGKTALGLEDLAGQLGFKSADDLFEVVGKDEFSLRTIENMLRPNEPVPSADELVLAKMRAGPDRSAQGGVLVVGVDSLLTQLAKCCKPAPPDPIRGFVTRGKGVSIHRSDCSNFRNMASGSPERVIEVKWNASTPALYPVDIAIEAADRQGLLRDISEAFSREKVNVTGVQTQSLRDHHGDSARMTFTVEIGDARAVQRVLAAVAQVAGVRLARRR